MPTASAAITSAVAPAKPCRCFDRMIAAYPLSPEENSTSSNPGARRRGRRQGNGLDVGKDFVRRLERHTGRFGNWSRQWIQERPTRADVPPQQHGIVFMHGVVAVLHEHAAPIAEL